MEENKEIKPVPPVKKENNILKPNKAVALVAYILLMFFLGTGIMILVALIVSKTRSLDYDTLYKVLADSKAYEHYSSDYLVASYYIQGVSNFITYLIALLIIVFYTRDALVTDFKDLIERRTRLAWLIPVLALAFTGIAYLIDFLVSKAVPASNNQSTIVGILQTGAAPIMVICTILFAPIVEELVFRKCIFSMLKDRVGVVWCYIISTFLFALPHMLSTPVDNVGIWLLQCVPYVICGALLCGVYHLSRFNIYASILAHMFNNILAVLLVLWR